MSLDLTLEEPQIVSVASHNITHNLSGMAHELNIYELLWHPEKNRIKTARQLINPLRVAIAEMEEDPARFKAYSSPNGWGTYEDFLPWLKEVLKSCEEHPKAGVRADR
jgi:hypothetical protein